MRVLRLLGLMISTLAFGSSLAIATPITYSETAFAVGSLGGAAFSGQITLTVSTDTSFIGSVPKQFLVYALQPATISVSGIGTAEFLSPHDMQVFTDQTCSCVGFYVVADGFIVELGNVAFQTYDLSTPIGPISCCGMLSFGIGHTTLGDLQIDSIRNGTFSAVTATAVPEPTSFVLLGSGLVITIRRRLKNRWLSRRA